MASDKLLVKNGIVFDPLSKIEGEVKDILIEDGIIVDKFSSDTDVKEIDASKKTVIPAALDIHAHFASQQVNWARLLGSKNKRFQEIWEGLRLESIARNYISNGYTFIVEANIFPSLAKQTIFDFKNFPVLDKAMLLNVSNFWPLELEFQKGKIEDMAIFLSDLLSIIKGFGFKAYNPFESANWDFKVLRDDLGKQGRLYNFNALDVYQNLTQCVEFLSLPHSIHAHIEGYEQEQGIKNVFEVLERIKSLGLNSNNGRSQIFHLAHASSYNINGDNSKLIKYFNDNQYLDLDLGFIGFNEINPLITSDRRLINSMVVMDEPNKLIRSAVEFEGDSFSTIRNFDKKKELDCIIWANAIDLALNIKNKYQIQMSINFPNYANITDIPDIATWLMSAEARDIYMKDMNSDFLKNTDLSSNDKNLSFNEFIIITRASPAKSLGLGAIKGNLGIGADGDVNLLDINVDDINLDKNSEALKKSLQNIEIVIKAGEIIKKQEAVDLKHQGKIYWSEGILQNNDSRLILSKKKDFYQKYSSNFYDSFKTSIGSEYLRKI